MVDSLYRDGAAVLSYRPPYDRHEYQPECQIGIGINPNGWHMDLSWRINLTNWCAAPIWKQPCTTQKC